jgi:hypothetical protein
MSNFFEDLTELIAENPVGQVLAFAWLIFLVSAVIAAVLVVLILKLIFPRIA